MEKANFSLLFILFLVLAVVLACGPSVTPAPATISETPPSRISTPTATPKPTVLATPASFVGKTVTMVVPYAAGGAVDVMARLYARFFGKHLPGQPSVIVRNMPGANGTIGSNYAYTAKPDGLTLLASGAGNQIAQLLGSRAVRYDLTMMTGLVGFTGGGVFYMTPGIISKPGDLVKAKGIIYGAGPETSGGVLLFLAVKELLGIPTEKVIVSYSGSADSRRAFLSGEVNMAFGGTPEYRDINQYVEKGSVAIAFQTGILDKSGGMVKEGAAPPNVPTVKELYEQVHGKSPSGIQWDAFRAVLSAAISYGRSPFLPRATPDNIVQTYWRVSETMLRDPDFVKMAGGIAGEEANWAVGDDFDQAFKLNFAIKPEVRDWLRSTLGQYNIVVD